MGDPRHPTPALPSHGRRKEAAGAEATDREHTSSCKTSHLLFLTITPSTRHECSATTAAGSAGRRHILVAYRGEHEGGGEKQHTRRPRPPTLILSSLRLLTRLPSLPLPHYSSWRSDNNSIRS